MKRFWSETRVLASEAQPGAFEVALDDKPIRTPSRAALALPTRPLAEAVAAEWAAQTDRVDPLSMPLTRAANTAIDRVLPDPTAARAQVAAYGETDLLCYRAPEPEALAAEQAEAWDPLLDWAARRYGARLSVAEGVMFSAQDEAAIARLAEAVAALGPWRLTALHELVTLSGSLVIGLAVIEGRLEPGDAWAASRIDERWNERQWGWDAEAAALAERREAAFRASARLVALLDAEAAGAG
ncbi:MAG: ATP12 family chaperone protein [Paracoccaceae bacterium]